MVLTDLIQICILLYLLLFRYMYHVKCGVGFVLLSSVVLPALQQN